MKVQKIVSLDVKTAELASEMRNFSLFVRQQLHAYDCGDTIIDKDKRIASFNRAFQLICKDIAKERMLAGHPQGHKEWSDLYKEYLNKAREELFQTNLGDF